MNIVVWKYKLDLEISFQKIKTQKGAEILSAGLDNNNNICIWALVNPKEKKETREFQLVSTGYFNEAWILIKRKFIGTFHYNTFIGHIFEVLND